MNKKSTDQSAHGLNKINSQIPITGFLFMWFTGVFQGQIWGHISAPFPIQKWAKTHKIVHIIPNFLVLDFGENFMKIWTKIPKLQMHENKFE